MADENRVRGSPRIGGKFADKSPIILINLNRQLGVLISCCRLIATPPPPGLAFGEPDGRRRRGGISLTISESVIPPII
jgi:hypothetical protein